MRQIKEISFAIKSLHVCDKNIQDPLEINKKNWTSS